MTINSFLKLVEIRTKVASVMPFLIGAAFTYYRYKVVDPLTLAVFFLSLICIDMATTAINNYMDYKRANKRAGFNYEEHNAIVRHGLKERSVIIAISLLLLLTVLSGLYLYERTDFVILIIGVSAFCVGVLYSFGPLPISSTPLGELFSGVMMGGFIYFVTIYAQIYDKGIIHFTLNNWILVIHANILELLVIAVTSAPLVLLIANIMLANNICDMEDDYENHRYTLPFYLGRENSLILFKILYGISYVFVLAAILFRFLPYVSALMLITIIPVSGNIKGFDALQHKGKTFDLAVKNFLLISGIYLLSLVLHIGAEIVFTLG